MKQTVPMSQKKYMDFYREMNNPKLYKEEHDACGIGAVVNIDGHADYKVLDDALHIVEKLEHRAGKDATGKVGDGVGIQVQVSYDFFREAAAKCGIELRGPRDFGVGMFFFPTDRLKQTFARRRFEVIVKKNGLKFLGWRKVPTHPEILGEVARDCMPDIWQCFIDRPEDAKRGLEFDRRLYVVRREFEQSQEDMTIEGTEQTSIQPTDNSAGDRKVAEKRKVGYHETYICSLSSRTIVYKGMFLVKQLRNFYEDLQSKNYKTAIAMVHSRFSTNTTPSWERAHPYRMIAHNGEINTIRGNIDRMLAREETMSSPILEGDEDKVFPVIPKYASDSAMLDNTLEFFYMNGMELPLAVMMLIPEPWKHNRFMDQEKKDFYHYYAQINSQHTF